MSENYLNLSVIVEIVHNNKLRCFISMLVPSFYEKHFSVIEKNLFKKN